MRCTIIGNDVRPGTKGEAPGVAPRPVNRPRSSRAGDGTGVTRRAGVFGRGQLHVAAFGGNVLTAAAALLIVVLQTRRGPRLARAVIDLLGGHTASPKRHNQGMPAPAAPVPRASPPVC